MKITKSWFYKLSEIISSWDKEIIIWDDIFVALFDDVKIDIDVHVWKNTKLELYGYLYWNNDSKINVFQSELLSSLKCNYLLVSGKQEELKAKVKSVLSSDEVKSNVKIVSMVLDDWSIDIDGSINIEEGIENLDWHLIEENIFIWSSWKIKALPTLLVSSNNVKASHACKIERISDEKFFYLRSRWVWRQNALSMMMEAKVLDLFSCLTMMDKEFFDELLENILKKIS